MLEYKVLRNKRKLVLEVCTCATYCERQKGREECSLIISGELGQYILQNDHKLRETRRRSLVILSLFDHAQSAPVSLWSSLQLFSVSLWSCYFVPQLPAELSSPSPFLQLDCQFGSGIVSTEEETKNMLLFINTQ